MSLLGAQTATSAYLELFPALLVWGIGLAFLTPAVVTAAVGRRAQGEGWAGVGIQQHRPPGSGRDWDRRVRRPRG